LWHELHCAVTAYGMWLDGLTCPSKKSVPEWHWLQSPVVGCAGSLIAVAPPALVGRAWKPVYLVVLLPRVVGR